MQTEYNFSIFVFDEQGYSGVTIGYPWHEDQIKTLMDVGDTFEILPKALPGTYWRDPQTEEVFTRVEVELPSPDRLKILNNGIDTIQFSGLPQNCVLIIDGESYEVEDGSFELIGDQPGVYSVSLGAKHVSNTIFVEVADLETERLKKWEEVKAARTEQRRITETSFGPFDSDEASMAVISGIAFDLSTDPDAENIVFGMADNQSKTFTPEEFIQAHSEVRKGIQAVMQNSLTLRDQINSLETLEELELFMPTTE